MACEIVGSPEVGKGCSQLIVIVVMKALNRRALDRPRHPLDLAFGPGMGWLGETVLAPIRLADHVEPYLP